MKNKVPDRWLEYTAMGTKVAGTRFIAFKAPLKKEICSRMKPQDRFTPEILMERCPNMRLIIDLTNTDRYYNKQEFIDRGIQYEKIMCPGQVIPPQSLIFRFFEIIDDFYLKNGFKDVLIGIHCTHGVNRTGYFIGRYMVQRMGFRFDKAIFCIEEARGHKIERLNYVKDLNCQDPIPSSLSSSGKKVIDTCKPEQKNGSNVGPSKSGGKVTRPRTPEKSYRKPPSELHDFPSKPQRVRTPDQAYKPKVIAGRSGNFSSSSGRLYSPVKRGTTPMKRDRASPNRRGFSPGRRPSPVGRGISSHPGSGRGPRGFSPGGRVSSGRAPRGPSPIARAPRGPSPVGRAPRGPSPSGRPLRPSSPFGRVPRGPSPVGRAPRGTSPKRFRSSPSRNMPRPFERQRSPPRRPSPRRFSPKKETDFGLPPFRGGEDRDVSRGSVSYRSYSSPARSPPVSNFSREQSDNPRIYGQSSDSEWRTPYEKGFDLSSGSTSGYGHAPPNQYTVSRTSDRNWEGWSHERSNSSASRPHSSSASSQPWNHPTTTFTAPPPPNLNVPPPGYDSRSGRFLERRFDGPSPRDDGRKQWNNERSSELSLPSSSGYQEPKGFVERSNDYRSRPQEKYEKPYCSPPREFNREKRQPSPSRDYSRNYDPGLGRIETTTWTHQKPSLEPAAFSEYRSGTRKKSRSPVGRASPLPPHSRKSRSPRRRSPGRRNVGGSYEQRRSPPRSRPGEQPAFHPSSFNAPPPPNPSQHPYQDKRYFESSDDCRDILNQKRHFDSGDQRDYYNEPKSKLDIRVVPKEVDLRNVISRSGHQEPPLKERLGPPPRDDPAQDFNRRYGGRGRSRSPRPRSPPHYGAQPHRRY